ncbi:indole-3-acetic acid-induced protein arg7 [Phtheirospermum japonicum]|uniref:Indole-3-acetic acid-induced protein arg7 n=1 Tax=Phtheirospermum japonicum TaxID=374723 RepID=A0A830CR76_9LAMI|nr:indole-3-acetic acid-induced protein arg7 [Phtheirospermum japonicum]
MLGKKLDSMKKLVKKVKTIGANSSIEYCSVRESDKGSTATTPTGTFPVYVGEKRLRFVVPTSYISHPLFKILLEKAYNEFGFEQKKGLVVPCSVAAFQEIIAAVESSNGFDFGDLVEEFL